MHDLKNVAHWKEKPKLGHWTNHNLRRKGKMNDFEVTLQDVPYTPHLTCILRCLWCFTLFSCYNLNKLPKKKDYNAHVFSIHFRDTHNKCGKIEAKMHMSEFYQFLNSKVSCC